MRTRRLAGVPANIVEACRPSALRDVEPSTFVLAMTVLANRVSDLAREAVRRMRAPATRDLAGELRAAQDRLNRQRGQGMGWGR